MPRLVPALLATLIGAFAMADDKPKKPGKEKPQIPAMFDIRLSGDWKTLPSGVRVWDVKIGAGNELKQDGAIWMHYTTYLSDGTVVYSTIPHGTHAADTFKGMLPGVKAGLAGVKPGGHRRLIVPAELAYGAKGNGRNVPPNSILMFDIVVVGPK